ncbi:MAG: BrnA antitoxin family protein [Pseudomonadota bacterium]
MKSKKLKPIPKFKSEEEEFKFWEKHDTADYIDWSKARHTIFPNLKPSSQTISLRLPLSMLDDIKVMANKRDVPYQSLMKIIIADAIARERHMDK